ncbi:hypothetical protein KPL70_024891 [Citrus sinensis]|nr:hypothetical protein KPL70_024891 [Citrus sinensis]
MLSTENSLDKNNPPPLEDDRSTKKTKFRAQGEDGDNPSMLFFRDKPMEQQKGVIDAEVGREEFMGKENDNEIENEDVVIEREGFLPSISFSQKVHEQLIKPWHSTVVVKLLGRMIGYKAFCSRLGIFSNEKIDEITAWIRLPGMPLHYYHKKIIRMLGHVIGKVIKIDYNTELATKGKFTRNAVEASLKSPLISQFLLDGRIQRFEYEVLPTICFGCGKCGHTSSSCPDKLILEARGEKMNDMASGETTNEISYVSPAVVTPDNPRFGPWMIVARKGNYRGNKGRADAKETNQNNFGKQSVSSRFDVLRQESELDNDSGEISNAAITMDNHKKTVAPPKNRENMISRDSKSSTLTMISGSKGKPVTRNRKVATSEHTTLKPSREIHSTPPPPQPMEKNISRNKSKSSMTHYLEPTFIPTSLDHKYHSAIILKNNSKNGTIQAPPSMPPEPNPNEEPPDIGDREMDKVEEDSSDTRL